MVEHEIHFAYPAPEQAREFTIMQMGKFRKTLPYECDRSSGWMVENMILTTAGKGYAYLDGVRHDGVPGTFWLLAKDRPYDLNIDEATGFWEGYWLEYDGAWVRSVQAICGLPPLCSVPGCRDLLPVFEELFELIADDAADLAPEAASHLWRILAAGGRIYRQGQPSLDRAHWVVATARQWAADHIGEAIGVKDMARSAGVSLFHFTRLFRTVTGYTPGAYLHRLRINRACDLLRNSELNVSEVGQAVGYPVLQHFSLAFKKITGLSPREYRKR